MEISEKIKLLRNKKNMTQNELAEALGVQRNTITQYEAGRIIPPAQNLKKLADVFSVSTDFLLDNQQDMQAVDIPSIQKTSFGNTYMDAIFSITAKNICEQLVSENDFFTKNKEVMYKVVESLLFLNIQTQKEKQSEFLICLSKNDDFNDINKKIIEYAKQLAQMEKLQKLMEEK